MKLKKVGFFRELRHGDEDGASLKELINHISQKNESKIISYLNQGKLFITCLGINRDVLDRSSPFISPPHILTDGFWTWPNDLPYYIEKYHVRLPDEFISHMQSKNWIISPESEINLEVLEL